MGSFTEAEFEPENEPENEPDEEVETAPDEGVDLKQESFPFTDEEIDAVIKSMPPPDPEAVNRFRRVYRGSDGDLLGRSGDQPKE